jgi:hypothetical protein
MATIDNKIINYCVTKTLYAALEDRANQSDKKPVFSKDEWQHLANFNQDERSQLKRKDVFKFNADAIKVIIAMLRLYIKEIDAAAYEPDTSTYEYLEMVGEENDNGVASVVVKMRNHPLADLKEGVLTALIVDPKYYIEALIDGPVEKSCKDASAEIRLALRGTFTTFIKTLCNIISVELWVKGSGGSTISATTLKLHMALMGVKEETLDAIDNEVEIIKSEKPAKAKVAKK